MLDISRGSRFEITLCSKTFNAETNIKHLGPVEVSASMVKAACVESGYQ